MPGSIGRRYFSISPLNRLNRPRRRWARHNRRFINAWANSIHELLPTVIVGILPHTFGPLSMTVDRVPFVVSFQSTPERDLNPREPAEQWLVHHALERADSLTVLLPSLVQQIPHRFRSKASVIPNYIDAVNPERTGAEFRRIISVGRLAPEKDYRILVEAMAIVAKRYPDWHLAIYGSGRLQAELLEQIQSRQLLRHVFLVGETNDVHGELARSDIFVAPSLVEGFGLAMAEAMSAGLPVIGFADCQAIDYLIRQFDGGLVVSRRSADELAAAICQLISNCELRTTLGRKATSIRVLDRDLYAKRWTTLLDIVGGRNDCSFDRHSLL
jgi:glycosyltransferase involved in cell wall biosynthesis